MKKQNKQPVQLDKVILPEPNVHVLNEIPFSYNSISFENFHLFTEVFNTINKNDALTPVLFIKYLFLSGSVVAMMQLYLLDKEGNPPSEDFIKTVPPAQILNSLTDFFDSEGNLLLNGIFSLLKSIR